MANKSIIESIRDFILTCDFLKDYSVNVDYLGVEMSYSIDPLPSDPIIKRYVDGGTLRQFQFAFTSRELYDNSVVQTIENSGFYQAFEEWIETQNRNKSFPILEDAKKETTEIQVNTSGYLFDNEADTARYQIQLNLIYKQEV